MGCIWCKWSKLWRLGLPIWLVRLFATRIDGGQHGPESSAAQEEVVQNANVRLVIAGHAHSPQVAHIRTSGTLKQYYIDTGTWRNRVLLTPSRDSFWRVKALTYVIVYASDEGPSHHDATAHEPRLLKHLRDRWVLSERQQPQRQLRFNLVLGHGATRVQ